MLCLHIHEHRTAPDKRFYESLDILWQVSFYLFYKFILVTYIE